MALIQRRLQCKRRLQSIIPCQNSGWENVLQNAPMAAGNKAAGIKMAGRNQNVVKHASMQQAGQAGAKHAAINHAARAASRAGGKAIKAGMEKL